MIHIDDVIKKNGPCALLSSDRNNCTVKALSATFQVPYDTAFNFAQEKWSRKPEKGIPLSKFREVLPMGLEVGHILGKWVVKVDSTRGYRQTGGWIRERKLTVASFKDQYSSGSYYVIVRGHALSIIDGQVVDHLKSEKRRIVYAWKVENN